MRVISKKSLKTFWEKHPQSQQQLWAWHKEMEEGKWMNHNELKLQYANASVINTKRVVFNIHGNSYRLVADFEYKLQLIFVVWIGTHKEYDKLGIQNIRYENKTHKK